MSRSQSERDMSRLWIEYLRHILDEAEYLSVHSQGLSRERLISDETLRRAFVRSIEIIGEATKQVPETVRQKYPHIEWRAMLLRSYAPIQATLWWHAAT